MNGDKERTSGHEEFKIKGTLSEKGVEISRKEHLDELSSKGYGTAEKKALSLSFYEALYLLDKGLLDIADKKSKKTNFQKVLQLYKNINENAWVEYLTYRDLRSRGYVVREGFGFGVDFRVYERGEYNKGAAKYLVLSIQEGKPISMEKLTHILLRSQSLKKELVLASMNRRGEIVYYSVSQLTLK
jgi:tRNA-intron endonuclease